MRFGPIFLTGLVFLATACSTPAHRISGTDVPNIPGTTLVQSSFQSVRGSVEAGEATFSGSIYDALERARWTRRGFLKDGWAEESITGTPLQATAVFTSPWPGKHLRRVAVVDISAAQFRGSATVTVSVEPFPGDPGDTAKPSPHTGTSAPTGAVTTADDGAQDADH